MSTESNIKVTFDLNVLFQSADEVNRLEKSNAPNRKQTTMDAERKQGDKGNVKTHSYLRKPLQKITVIIYNYKTDCPVYV